MRLFSFCGNERIVGPYIYICGGLGKRNLLDKREIQRNVSYFEECIYALFSSVSCLCNLKLGTTTCMQVLASEC